MPQFIKQHLEFFTGLLIGLVLGQFLALCIFYWPTGKSWFDLADVFATALVGFAALYIARQQLLIKQLERKQFDFEKKWVAYDVMSSQIAEFEHRLENDSNIEEVAKFTTKLINSKRKLCMIYGKRYEKEINSSFNQFLTELRKVAATSDTLKDRSERYIKVCEKAHDELFQICERELKNVL